MKYSYHIYNFDSLGNTLLYDILALRSEVFVVEQNSPYQDIDGMDAQALHLCVMEGDALVAYARLFEPGVKFDEASVGRIVIAASHRGKGMGRPLVQHAMDALRARCGEVAFRIEAQYHLREFYGSLGFAIVSDIYDWGGIEHVKMVCPAQQPAKKSA